MRRRTPMAEFVFTYRLPQDYIPVDLTDPR